jgi:hypothetical protein
MPPGNEPGENNTRNGVIRGKSDASRLFNRDGDWGVGVSTPRRVAQSPSI